MSAGLAYTIDTNSCRDRHDWSAYKHLRGCRLGSRRKTEGGNMKNVRVAVLIGLSCSAILVLVRIGTAVAMPGFGL